MTVGDLVKHKCSFNKYDGFGIVVGFRDGRALVDWFKAGYREYHPPHYLEALCK